VLAAGKCYCQRSEKPLWADDPVDHGRVRAGGVGTRGSCDSLHDSYVLGMALWQPGLQISAADVKELVRLDVDPAGGGGRDKSSSRVVLPGPGGPVRRRTPLAIGLTLSALPLPRAQNEQSQPVCRAS
jgi:hypothetical protein